MYAVEVRRNAVCAMERMVHVMPFSWNGSAWNHDCTTDLSGNLHICCCFLSARECFTADIKFRWGFFSHSNEMATRIAICNRTTEYCNNNIVNNVCNVRNVFSSFDEYGIIWINSDRKKETEIDDDSSSENHQRLMKSIFWTGKFQCEIDPLPCKRNLIEQQTDYDVVTYLFNHRILQSGELYFPISFLIWVWNSSIFIAFNERRMLWIESTKLIFFFHQNRFYQNDGLHYAIMWRPSRFANFK